MGVHSALANTAVWLFLNASGIVRMGETVLPYPVYVFTGTMLWAIFMEAASAPLQQTTAAKPMLAKINFPREALIVSGNYQTLFNAGIKIALIYRRSCCWGCSRIGVCCYSHWRWGR